MEIACENIEQFKKKDKLDENINTHIKLLKQFESLLQTTLRHLIQISIHKQNDAEYVSKLKKLYSYALQSHIDREDSSEFSQHILRTLQTVQDQINC